jgi:glycosyltransferase involved in cell wall biosynthesis
MVAVMSEPRVAVLVACFNDGETLPETIASLVRQGEPLEIVVVNDGSTDPATLETLERIAHEPSVRVLHQENHGLAEARNAALRASSAPYVLALDSDDLCPPGAIAAMADALDGDPELAVSYGDIQTFGEINELRRSQRTLDRWLVRYLSPIPVASMVRRRLLEQVGGWYPMLSEDWDLWMSLVEAGARGRHVGRVTLLYRTRPRRMARDAFARQAEIERLLRQRHPAIFAGGLRAWWRSEAPWSARLVLPLASALRLSAATRLRIAWLVTNPRPTVGALCRRARARLSLSSS